MIQPQVDVKLCPLNYPIDTPEGPWEPGPGVFDMLGTIDVQDQGQPLSGVGTVDIRKTRIDALDDGWRYMLGELGAEWLIEFDVVRVNRDHRGQRYGLRLVAEALAQLSAGCTCHTTILAEPN